MASTSHRDDRICRLRDEGLSLAAIRRSLAVERADWDVCEGTISRVLKRRHRSTRKRRSDAGAQRSARITEQQEAVIVSILMGLGKTGHPGKPKITSISTQQAIHEAESQGLIPPGVATPAKINRRLREHWNIHRRGAEARRNGPGVVRRFEAHRAGALYQFDGTLAQSFYVDASGDFTYLPGTELKEQLKVASKTRAYILAVIDDYSRCVRLAAYDGETAHNVILFLRQLLCRSDDLHRPLCGIPTCLYADNGSALSSVAAKRVLDAFDVRGRPRHMPRSAWSKGKIERAFQATNGFQGIIRGRKLRSFVEFNEFLRQIEIELNNRVHSSTGEKPIERFLTSCAHSAAEGKWRYASPDDALWTRFAMVRLDEARVRADLVVALGRGEQLSLPHERPYVDWIGKTITVYLHTAPDKERAAKTGETCVVVDPTGAHEYTILRLAPTIARSLVGKAPVTTARDELVDRARAASELIDREKSGQWIGREGMAASLPDAPMVAPPKADQPVARLTRHQVVGELIDCGLFDPASDSDAALIDSIMCGHDCITRSRLDYLIEEGRLPEDQLSDEEAA